MKRSGSENGSDYMEYLYKRPVSNISKNISICMFMCILLNQFLNLVVLFLSEQNENL